MTNEDHLINNGSWCASCGEAWPCAGLRDDGMRHIEQRPFELSDEVKPYFSNEPLPPKVVAQVLHADDVRRAEKRGERNAYLLAYVVAIATWLILKAWGQEYVAPAANVGLLALAFLAHYRSRHNDGVDHENG